MVVPVVEEYALRHPGERVLVETDYPEVFRNSPHVERAEVFVDEPDEQLVCLDEVHEMNQLRFKTVDGFETRSYPDHLMDSYASVLLGDTRLMSRSIRLYPSGEEALEGRMVADRRTAVVSFGGPRVTVEPGVKAEVCEGLVRLGYEVIAIDAVNGDIHRLHAIIDSARLFVGTDCDVAYLAMATETPMVMAFSYRHPLYWHPFRCGIPFFGFMPPYHVCSESAVCEEKYAAVEQGVVHYIRCPLEGQPCISGFVASDFLKGVEEVLRCERLG